MSEHSAEKDAGRLEGRMFLAADIRDELAEASDLPFGDRNRIAWDTVDALDYDSDPALPALLEEARRAGIPRRAEGDAIPDECGSCGEGMPEGECPQSRRDCGHHCNHVWTHDACDWCGLVFGDDNEVPGGPNA